MAERALGTVLEGGSYYLTAVRRARNIAAREGVRAVAADPDSTPDAHFRRREERDGSDEVDLFDRFRTRAMSFRIMPAVFASLV